MTNYYVDPDASGSADGTSYTDAYTSLNACLAAITLTEDSTIYCRSSSGTADTTAATCSGVAGTYKLTITTETSEATGRNTSPAWDSANYRLSLTNATALTVADDNVEVIGLQIEVTAANANDQTGIKWTYTGGGSITVEKNIIRGDLSETNNHGYYGLFCRNTAGTGATIYASNNIFQNWDSTANSGAIRVDDAQLTAYVYYNVAHLCYDGFQQINGSATGYNNLSFPNTRDGFLNTWSGDNNITDDATGPGSNGLDNRTLTASTSPGTGDWVMVSNLTAGSEDYTLQDDAENDALAAGTPLHADANYAVSDDYLGTTRDTSTPDVGAIELDSGSGTTVSGALTSQSATVSGSLTSFAVESLSGSVTSQSASVSGALNSFTIITLSGGVASASASVSGSISNAAATTLSGAVSSQSAIVTGAIERAATFSGSVASQQAVISGSLTRAVTLNGSLQSQESSVSGSLAAGTIATLSGSLSAQNASVNGVLERAVSLSGGVQAQSSGISGVISRLLDFQGSLQSQSATITGVVGVPQPHTLAPPKRTFFADHDGRVVSVGRESRVVFAGRENRNIYE